MADQEIRSFIAVELPQNVKSALLSIQDDLRSSKGNFVKWVAPQGMHLTLKFLGNVSFDKVEQIIRAIQEGCEGQKPFSTQISGIGTFPSINRPRVLWIGITGQLAEIIDLQKKIDSKLELIGFSREKRPFSPHITLARVGDRALPGEIEEFSKSLQKYQHDVKHTVSINAVSLIRSQLFRDGAVYNILSEVKLGS